MISILSLLLKFIVVSFVVVNGQVNYCGYSMGIWSKNIFPTFRVQSLIYIHHYLPLYLCCWSLLCPYLFLVRLSERMCCYFLRCGKAEEEPFLGRGGRSRVWRNHKFCWRCLLEHLQPKITLAIKKSAP